MYITDLVPGRVWRRDLAGEYTLVSDEVAVPNGITCVGDRLFVSEMRPDDRLLELFTDGREQRVLTGGLAMANAMQLGQTAVSTTRTCSPVGSAGISSVAVGPKWSPRTCTSRSRSGSTRRAC
jgi:hypothetical protein